MSVRAFKGVRPILAASAYVDPDAVVIGDVHLDADSSLWPRVVARGDVNRIAIGRRTNIQDGSVLHVTGRSPLVPEGHPLVVGDEVTVGHQVILHGCSIGDRCLIGMGSTIMDGAILESEIILGAGSLVTPGKLLQAGFLWLGRPARKVRPLTEGELEHFHASAAAYVALKDQYREGEAQP